MKCAVKKSPESLKGNTSSITEVSRVSQIGSRTWRTLLRLFWWLALLDTVAGHALFFYTWCKPFQDNDNNTHPGRLSTFLAIFSLLFVRAGARTKGIYHLFLDVLPRLHTEDFVLFLFRSCVFEAQKNDEN